MSRILRRPMFRGGKVDSRGTGITSGLMDKPKRGLVDEPGGYSGFRSATEIYSDAERQVPDAKTEEKIKFMCHVDLRWY